MYFRVMQKRLFYCMAIMIVWCTHCSAEQTRNRPSQKKGFCTVVRDDGEWLHKVESLNAKWFYSWGQKRPEGTPRGVEYTPMIWGKYNARRPAILERLKQEGSRGEIKCLMGFNEPDQNEQSNLSVQEALDLWPNLMATGLPLASPSCVHPDRDWMKMFMAEAEERELRVDYISVHSYSGANAEALISRLERVHEMFGRPIWITEFAVGDWSAKSVAENKHSPEKIAAFMLEILPRLEKLDYVHRYAWFSASPDNAPLGNSALFKKDGSLTELGKIYRSF